MFTLRHRIELTEDQITQIEAALQTQEKILAVQTRAPDHHGISARLTALRALQTQLRQSRKPSRGWSLFGLTALLGSEPIDFRGAA